MSFIFKWKKQVNWLRQQEQGELLDDPPSREKESEVQDFKCRICGLKAPAPDYCPECLADTMEPVPPRS
jgi:rubrerythrin